MPSRKKAVSTAQASPRPPVAKPDLWDKIAEIERRCIAVRPAGTFTTAEYAALRKLSRNKADHTLHILEKIGELEKIKVPGSIKVYWRIK